MAPWSVQGQAGQWRGLEVEVEAPLNSPAKGKGERVFFAPEETLTPLRVVSFTFCRFGYEYMRRLCAFFSEAPVLQPLTGSTMEVTDGRTDGTLEGETKNRHPGRP